MVIKVKAKRRPVLGVIWGIAAGPMLIALSSLFLLIPVIGWAIFLAAIVAGLLLPVIGFFMITARCPHCNAFVLGVKSGKCHKCKTRYAKDYTNSQLIFRG